MKGNKIKISHGMLISFAVLILLTILILWLVQTVFMDEFYYNVKEDDLENVSQKITAMLDGEAQKKLQDTNFEKSIFDLCIENEMSHAIIINGMTSGNAYMHDDKLFSLFVDGKLDEHIQSVQESNSSKIIPITEGPSPDTATTSALLLVKCISNEENNAITLILCTNIYPTSSMTRTIRIQLISVCFLTLAVAIVISLLVSRKIAQPVTLLSKEAKKLAKGNYDLDYPKPSGLQEVDELVNTLKYSATELERTEKLQKDLVANISHDLRTPLTLIQGYAELMRDIPPENNAKNLGVIIDEVKHLSSLVNDVLDLSKLQSGTAEFNDEQFDLITLTEEIIARYTDLCENEGFEFSLKKPDSKVMINADRKKIASVIHNLLSNAVKYTGIEKKIYVLIETAENKVRLSVRDTGAGIPEDKIKDIWQRYYKIDSSESHTRAKVGSGIGLAIVKSVLDHYCATYGVNSSEKGSIFWFIFNTL